ncbi:MAG: GTP 3',8-cyclase MoaA [Clostridia bacterium]|nr:GTP 3',8-cyclase MoaA [Clostridia bacterium]
MQDLFQREINYLRISITDRCNLRCIYCMPQEGVPLTNSILRFEEFEKIVRSAVGIGIRKVRLTGGEPLVRKGVIEFISRLAAIPEIDDLALTTNGILLADKAKALKEAGLTRVNLSLDTLRGDRFAEITRGGKLAEVLLGIKEAFVVGLEPVKVNMVVMKGFNDDEVLDFAGMTREFPIHIRFIELMPIGESDNWCKDRHIPVKEIKKMLDPLGKLERAKIGAGNGPARYFRLPGAPGTIGFISAISSHFCDSCNRLRLTSEGQLRLCLHSKTEVDLKTPLRQGASEEELAHIIAEAIKDKPRKHTMADEGWADNQRMMSQIGG